MCNKVSVWKPETGLSPSYSRNYTTLIQTNADPAWCGAGSGVTAHDDDLNHDGAEATRKQSEEGRGRRAEALRALPLKGIRDAPRGARGGWRQAEAVLAETCSQAERRLLGTPGLGVPGTRLQGAGGRQGAPEGSSLGKPCSLPARPVQVPFWTGKLVSP